NVLSASAAVSVQYVSRDARFMGVLPRPNGRFSLRPTLVPRSARSRTFSDLEEGNRSPKAAETEKRTSTRAGVPAAGPCHALVASHPGNGRPRGTIQTPRRAVASKLAGIGPLHPHRAWTMEV